MAIRSAAKAIIFRENKVLVNQCLVEETGEIYYDLPGGGQHQFETMEEAVVREVLEETGYSIQVIKFAAIAEEIYDDEALRKKYYDYSHRVLHIFLARLIADSPQKPTEIDFQQEKSEWISMEEANRIPFRPKSLNGKISAIVNGKYPQYLGSIHV